MTVKVIMVQALLFFKRASQRFFQYRCQYAASTLAYTTALAFVPFLSIIVSLLSIFALSQQTIDRLQSVLFSHFLPNQADRVLSLIQAFTQQAQRLPIVGFVFLLITTLILLSLIGKNINRLWAVHSHRCWQKRYLSYAFILIAIPGLISVSLSISSYLLSLQLLAKNGFIAAVRAEFLHFLPFIVELVGFTLLNWLVPNSKVKLRYAMLGGLLTTILFEIIKWSFGVYLKLFPTYDLLYGTMAIVPILLIWLYLFWLVVLFGVLFVYQCHHQCD